MRQKLKYFVFNKISDYEGGCMSHMLYDKDGIWADLSDGTGHSGFISRVLDSREEDTPWHRLTFSMTGGEEEPYLVTVFAGDGLTLAGGGDVPSLVADETVPFEEKLYRMGDFVKKRLASFSDMLLFEVRGRYLWIAVELFAHGGTPLKLGNFQVYFPKQSWISYLPEVYQASDKDQFLERYLAVFQILHESMNDQIRGIPGLLDVDMTSEENLVRLAEWLDIPGSYIWSGKQLRQLLRQAVRLYKMRGTKMGIRRMIRLYTGGEAYIVERHQLEPYMGDERIKNMLTMLYGSSPDVVLVILDKKYVPTQKVYHTLWRVIEEMKPAQVDVELVVLEPYMYLGGHTYMGINSAFGVYGDVRLDDQAMVSFSSLKQTEDLQEDSEV